MCPGTEQEENIQSRETRAPALFLPEPTSNQNYRLSHAAKGEGRSRGHQTHFHMCEVLEDLAPKHTFPGNRGSVQKMSKQRTCGIWKVRNQTRTKHVEFLQRQSKESRRGSRSMSFRGTQANTRRNIPRNWTWLTLELLAGRARSVDSPLCMWMTDKCPSD